MQNLKNICYSQVTKQLQQHGYIAPSMDEDVRMKKIWQLLEEKDISISFVPNFNYGSDLVSTNSKELKILQVRYKGHDEEKFKDYVYRFGTQKERLKRLPMLIECENGKYAPPVGNTRSRAHEKAQLTGPALLIGANLSLEDRLECGRQIAMISNTDYGEDVFPETRDDIVLQMTNELSVKLKRDKAKVIKDTKIEYYRDYVSVKLKEIKRKYEPENMHREAGKIAKEVVDNFCNKSVYARPITLYSDYNNTDQKVRDQINKELQMFWSQNSWDHVVEDPNICQVYDQAETTANLEQRLYTLWRMPNFTQQEFWVAHRIKTKQSQVTTDFIVKKTDSVLSIFEKWNKNTKHRNSHIPIINRVLILASYIGYDPVAYEWNKQTNKFDKKQKTLDK